MTTYTTEQLAQFPWIVSCGTLKTEDLLVRFWSAAETCAVLANKPELLTAGTLANLTRLVGEDSSESDWDDALASDTLGEVGSALCEVAPCGFDFGASEGDGSAFGFWLSEDWRDALDHCGIDEDSDPETLAAIIVELDGLGLGPEDMEDAYCGEAEGYTEEEAGADYAERLADELGIKTEQAQWPLCYIDWEAAWSDLATGDGYNLVQWSRSRWLVFRSV